MDKTRTKDNAVHRWLRRANKQLRNLDRIVFPVFCKRKEHFCCVLIDLKSKRIVLYDSMTDVYAEKGTSSVTSREMQMLRQWVSDESAKEPGEQGQWDTTAWEIKRAKCLQQNHGFDCGKKLYALFIIPLPHDKQHIPIRREPGKSRCCADNCKAFSALFYKSRDAVMPTRGIKHKLKLPKC